MSLGSFKASVGDEVGIYYDSEDELVVGDCIQTRTGRTYEIVSFRRQKGKEYRSIPFALRGS